MIDLDVFSFCYSETRRNKVSVWIVNFRKLYQGTYQPTKDLWYDTFPHEKFLDAPYH